MTDPKRSPARIYSQAPENQRLRASQSDGLMVELLISLSGMRLKRLYQLLSIVLLAVWMQGAQAVSLTFAWDPSEDAEAPGKITGYLLYYSQVQFTNNTAPGVTNISLGLQPLAIVQGLLAGQTYYFAVAATGPDGESDLSNVIEVTPGIIPPILPDGSISNIVTLPSPGTTTGSTTGSSTGETGGTTGSTTGSAPETELNLFGVQPRMWLYPTNGQALLAIAGSLGATFTIQSTTNIANGLSWLTVTNVKMSEVSADADPAPNGTLRKAFIPALQSWQDPAPIDNQLRFYRIFMPLGFAIVADEVLREQGFNTRLVAVRLPGIDAYIVCYVTDDSAYLDYNDVNYVARLQQSGATIREIATAVAAALSQNWTSASEFTVDTEGVKTLVATVVKTDDPGLDPPIGVTQPSTITIDF